MMPRLPLFLYAVSTSLFLAGFGSCGVDEVDPIPRPCVQLSEDECAASPSCELVPVRTGAAGLIAPDAEAPIPEDCVCPAICELRADGTCAPCECNQPPPTYECRPKLPSACEDLGEEACLADASCEPIYRGVACLQAPPDADPCDPSIPGCGGALPPCEPGIEFAGCQDRPVSCGPVCDIYCPYGNVRDANGCETCACNPPPTGCEGLDEYQCIQHPDCRPIYQAGDDPTDCLCAPCAEGEVCDCRCGTGSGGSGARPEPLPGEYLGCEYNQPTRCAGLDEAACVNTRGCRAVYDGGGATEPGFCYCPPCDPDSNEPCPGCDCAPTPPPGFAYCEDDVSGSCYDLDEASCHREPGCEARYSTLTVCSGGEGPGAGVPCDPNGEDCADRPAPPCYEETQFDGCFPLGGGQSCGSDADCPNGYCEKAGYCDAAGCEDYSYCVTPSCDDGSTAVCLIAPPVCGAGQTLAVRNGCFECVDARTCGGVEPNGCSSDADCPNGYCEHYATCTAIGCPPPPPSQCVYPRCDDGSEPLCPSLPMECAPGETLAVRNNCWACVDARSCEVPPPPPTCDEPAGLIYCDALPPQCDPGLILTARNGCWACVEPTYCQEVSCNDGSTLACRALAPICPPDSLLGIVNGCWECLDQNCQ